MPKGIFSQAMCLLTDGSVGTPDLGVALKEAGYEIVREIAAREDWSFSGPSLIVPYRPEVNGTVSIDAVSQPWPDAMGSPDSDPKTFAAWAMGAFGPFTFPRSLERAVVQSWAWKSARDVVSTHCGFVRIRLTYAGGAGPDTSIVPRDYDSTDEMIFLSQLVVALSNVAGVLCYFNPNGEVLREGEDFVSTWNAARKEQKLPLLLWTNARLFKLTSDFAFMDTVGNAQLDLKDVEVIYPSARYDAGVIDYYLRNVTHYLLSSGREIRSGDVIDGPGETELSWVAECADRGAVDAPPRPVLRLYPKSEQDAVRHALGSAWRSGS